MKDDNRTLLQKLLEVPVGYVFWMIFFWLIIVAGLIYLMTIV